MMAAMVQYSLQCLSTPVDEIETRSVTLSYDFAAEDDLTAVAIASEYFGAEIGAAVYAELVRDPTSPRTAPVRVWQEQL
jgi:hypothetical protein